MAKAIEVEAYNVKLKKKENMKNVELVKCDNGRWRAAGKGSDGTGMTKFLSDTDAEAMKKAGVPVRKMKKAGVPVRKK